MDHNDRCGADDFLSTCGSSFVLPVQCPVSSCDYFSVLVRGRMGEGSSR